jgi:hypothetical protein
MIVKGLKGQAREREQTQKKNQMSIYRFYLVSLILLTTQEKKEKGQISPLYIRC